jgi:hypothetical protein
MSVVDRRRSERSIVMSQRILVSMDDSPADPELVAEGCKKLADFFSAFIEEKMKINGTFKYVDGLMIVHNFYRAVIEDIADQTKTPASRWYKCAHATLEIAMNKVANRERNEVDPNKQ